MKTALFLALQMILSIGCTSLPNGYLPLDKDAVKSAAQADYEKCFKSQSPEMSLQVYLPGIGSVPMEGSWASNFEEFEAYVTTPWGGQLATLRIKNGKSTLESLLPLDQIKSLTNFRRAAEAIGSKNLRILFCGLHTSHPLLIQAASTSNEGIYTVTKMPVSLTSLKFRSITSMNSNERRVLSDIETTSMFLSQTARLEWLGTKELVGPRKITVDSGKSKIILDFVEFK